MSRRVVVLEGADASGKTTLAEEVLDGWGPDDYVYIHNTSSDAKLPGSLYRHYKAQLLDALERDIPVTVIDRSFLSEYVYGHIHRGKSRITRRQAVRLTRWARKQGIELIGMQAPLTLREGRMKSRGENFDLFYEIRVQARYHEFFRVHAWKTASSS